MQGEGEWKYRCSNAHGHLTRSLNTCKWSVKVSLPYGSGCQSVPGCFKCLQSLAQREGGSATRNEIRCIVLCSYPAFSTLYGRSVPEKQPTKALIAYATGETLILQTFPSNNDGDRLLLLLLMISLMEGKCAAWLEQAQLEQRLWGVPRLQTGRAFGDIPAVPAGVVGVSP